MLSFLLGLLKIVGIILLVLLVLVLVVLCIVLFVPIRYKGTGRITAEEKEASVKVTWLLHIVRFKLDYSYPDKPVISFKILWVDGLKLLKGKKEQNNNISSKEETYGTESNDIQANVEVLKGAEPQENTVKPSVDDQEGAQQETAEEVAEEVAKEPEKPNETLCEKIDKIIFKIKSIYDKIKNILYNMKYYIDILQEEDTKQLISHALQLLLKILKSIRPRVLKVNGEFGFNTPDTTGQVYGVYCMLRPSLGENVNLIPNFEESVLSGDVYFKGRITIFVLVINALRILFDKRLRPLMKKLKNGGK